MLKVRDASKEQKLVVTAILNTILKGLRIDHHYKILQDRDDIMVRQSTSNPPSSHQSKLLTQFLAELPLVKIKVGNIQMRGMYEQIKIPTFFITEINAALANQIVAKLSGSIAKKPAEVDEFTWSQLPKDITMRWDRFSPDLQKHLVDCIGADLQKHLAAIPDAMQSAIGITVQSPVGREAPSFPVRLPGATANPGEEKRDVNAVYDLMEVLAFQKDARGVRKNPLTREKFELNQVLPAPDALVEIKKRAEKLVADANKEEPKLGAVSGGPKPGRG
jgi:hypothetical protein